VSERVRERVSETRRWLRSETATRQHVDGNQRLVASPPDRASHRSPHSRRPTHRPSYPPTNPNLKIPNRVPSPTHLPNHNRTRPEQHNRLQISPLRNSLHSSVPSREIRLRSCHHANPTESPPPAPPRPPRAHCIPPTLYSSEWRRRPGHGERTGPCMKRRIQMEDFRHFNDVCVLPRLVPVLFYRRV